ncbi:hypothetical protein T03_4683 [Trichinella britovi]|uniref:Uncharacterized protein n=1 Tax=Trichinella britovi TaxID=45882 RepID=A0A0V1D6T5_TRIBR|nr:hypothetical protein T03_4683 [Trichinella britovi]
MQIKKRKNKKFGEVCKNGWMDGWMIVFILDDFVVVIVLRSVMIRFTFNIFYLLFCTALAAFQALFQLMLMLSISRWAYSYSHGKCKTYYSNIFPILHIKDHLKFYRLFIKSMSVRRKNACRASTKENWQHPLV